MARIDRYLAISATANYTGGGTNYVVQINAGSYYIVYADGNSDVAFIKSTDGVNWSAPTIVFAGTVTALSVWYDRWSGIAAGLIHCAYTESGNSDTLYRTINTESADALSTETTIFAGTSTAGGGALSIARSRGGNVYCKTMIDAGAEGGFFRLPNANVPNGAWDAALTDAEALATTDQWILLPGWAADNNDMMLVFVDASANGLSRYLFDDSGNSWGESAIIADGSFADSTAATDFPHLAAAVDIANSQNLLIAWNGRDTANADLTAWKITESAITGLTDVVTNGTDDQMGAALGIDTANGDLYAFYYGKSDGSETVNTSLRMYYKLSTDDGATWGAETVVTNSLASRRWMATIPRFTGSFMTAYLDIVGGSAIGASMNLPGGGGLRIAGRGGLAA